MNRPLITVVFIAAILIVSVTCQQDAMLAPPGRPSEFQTPEQLRSYLRALNNYYAIVGRPRFGRSVSKRQMEKVYKDAVDNFCLIQTVDGKLPSPGVCQDIHEDACAQLKAAQPYICHEDQTFAETTCPRTCGHCSLQCYSCPSPVFNPFDCNKTALCGPGMSCVTKHRHSSTNNEDQFIMDCEAKEICKIYNSGFVGKRDSTTFECCETDLCNSPAGTIQACSKDIVFLVDESGSLGEGNFRLVLDFVQSLIRNLDIGNLASRAAFVTFSSTVRVQWGLNDLSKQAMLDTFNKIQYMGGGTYTAEALKKIEHDVLNNPGDRAAVRNVIVVITDGQSNDNVATIREAFNLHHNGTEIISIGIGSGLRRDELGLIATDSQHVFVVDTFPALDSIKSNILNLFCD